MNVAIRSAQSSAVQPTVSPSPSGPPLIAAQLPQVFSVYQVAKVFNGRSFAVEIKDSEETVRLAGLDSPRAAEGDAPSQCFAIESTDHLRRFLTGKNVGLEPDLNQSDRDHHGRLLRFVRLTDGTDLNKLLISQGYAKEFSYNGYPHSRQKEYRDAQDQAIRAGRGLWSPGACSGDTLKPGPYVPFDLKLSGEIKPLGCSNFKTQVEAQRFYETHGGPYQDYFHLDGDRNGRPCEGLP